MTPEVFDTFVVGFSCLLAGFLGGVLFAVVLGNRQSGSSVDYEQFAAKKSPPPPRGGSGTPPKYIFPLNAAPGHVHKAYTIDLSSNPRKAHP
jgi:hypothetical protein